LVVGRVGWGSEASNLGEGGGRKTKNRTLTPVPKVHDNSLSSSKCRGRNLEKGVKRKERNESNRLVASSGRNINAMGVFGADRPNGCNGEGGRRRVELPQGEGRWHER